MDGNLTQNPIVGHRKKEHGIGLGNCLFVQSSISVPTYVQYIASSVSISSFCKTLEVIVNSTSKENNVLSFKEHKEIIAGKASCRLSKYNINSC